MTCHHNRDEGFCRDCEQEELIERLAAEVTRLRSQRDASRRCHVNAEQANTRLGAEVERLKKMLKTPLTDAYFDREGE